MNESADKLIGDSGDRYTHDAQLITPSPKSVWQRLRYLGPGVIISATIVGSGEIVLTASLGAAVGYGMLWWVLLSCWSKSIVQAELARYIVLSGDTYLRALNRAPGKIPGPWGPFGWPIGLGLIAFIPAFTGLAGIIGGAGQALVLLAPGLGVVADGIGVSFDLFAVAILALATSALLYTGSYRRLEWILLAFVAVFTVAVLFSLAFMQGTEYATRPADILGGLTFEFQPEYAVLALAAYGYTGVNSGEISAYSYWCIEKGYPRRIGPYDGSQAWQDRAHGWLAVLRTDVWMTLILLTCATVPFYFLGAGVLHPMGLRPEGSEMVASLSRMFTQTLGEWSLWLFGIGAFCILFSSTIAGIAAGARYIPDYLIEIGAGKRDQMAVRRRIIRWYGAVVPFVVLLLYAGVQRPVLMVSIAACFGAVMLPVQSGLTIYLQTRRLPKTMQPRRLAAIFLRITFVFQLVMAGLVIWFVAL